jgi:uncharacterized Tic20 family protein
MNNNSSNNKRKLLSIISYASVFSRSAVITIGIPIAILLLSKDTVVKKNAKEALNFFINAYIYGIIFAISLFVIPSFFLMGVLLFNI